jgi:hypothetical protein
MNDRYQGEALSCRGDRVGSFFAGPLVAERLVKETLRAEPGPTVGAALGGYFALNFCSG